MEKFTLEQELVKPLSDMLKSPDEGNIKMALEILENRDLNDEKSESQYFQLMKDIVNDEKLFPNCPLYVIDMGGRILTVKGMNGFTSETEAKRYLSLHLTRLIGSKKTANRWASPFNKALRTMFKSGNDMRNYLIKNKLVTIKQLK